MKGDGVLSSSKKNRINKEITRRDFIKITSGGIAGIALCSTPVKASELTGVSEPEVISEEDNKMVIKDSISRETVSVANIKRIVPSGKYAQIFLCSLCPEKIVSVAEDVDEKFREDCNRGEMENIMDIPETGELYGGQGRSLDVRSVEKTEPDMIFDIGFPKKDLKTSLDYLQAYADSPSIFIDGSFMKLPEAYRKAGEILDCIPKSERIASYIEKVYQDINSRRALVDKPFKILYAAYEQGIGFKEYRIQNDIITFLGGEPVLLPEGEHKETIDINSLYSEDIDFVVFNLHKTFDDIVKKEGETYNIWSKVTAIQEGKYAVAPALYHSWFGGTPLFPQIIGLYWLGNLLWPNIYNFDMVRVAKEFYEIMFNYNLTDDEALELLGY